MDILEMKSIKTFILLGLITFLISCNQQGIVKINQLNWLLGSRQMEAGEEIIMETWEQNNEILEGKSYAISGGDTTLTETIQIKELEGKLYYIPLVFDQNGGVEVKFELKSDNPEQLVFENLAHDFPKKICYYKDGKNINAWIEGGDKKIDFYLTVIDK